MVDLSFDSSKHDQTRQDASNGADSLHTVAKTAEAFANAQVSDVWGSEEEGVEAARQALVSAYEAACRGFLQRAISSAISAKWSTMPKRLSCGQKRNSYAY